MTTTSTITELARRFDKTIIAFHRADERSSAALRAKDDLEHARLSQEEERLRTERDALARAILDTPAQTPAEAVTLLTVTLGPLDLIVDGWSGKRKKAARALGALRSALSVLIDLPGVAIPGAIADWYGLRPPGDEDLLALLSERHRLVTFAQSKENSDAVIGEEASNALVTETSLKVAKIDHEAVDIVCSTTAGIIGQVELFHLLTEDGGFGAADIYHLSCCLDRLTASIKTGISRLGGAK